ncbi:MAG: thymidine phosphorylase [Chloroflexota bacterium]
MQVVQLIEKKKNGLELGTDEINWLIERTVSGDVPDYQLAALLMAIWCRGMTLRETTDLTLAMAQSGATLDLSEFSPPAVDKHSTGGVGDKTTLIVAPLVAACGVPVAKMSGHCLGFSGGTLDKLESIPGFNSALSKSEFLSVLRCVGLVIAGQSQDLAPADGRIYALRDQTATIDSLPLIASSILSKKIAAGAKVIVLDVKVGSGSFSKTMERATELARTMVQVGHSLGRSVTAVLSSMEQPLGRAIGNSVEVAEAVETLRGNGPPDLQELCFALGVELLVGAGVAGRDDAKTTLERSLQSGAALSKLAEMVKAQGGDSQVVLDFGLLPKAPVIRPVFSNTGGFVASIDAERLGWAVVALGGGRMAKGQRIDHRVGLVLHAKVGDRVAEGAPLVTVHAASETSWNEVAAQVASAFAFSATPVESPTLIKGVIAPSR